jgi:hypothetical protein
MQVCPAAPRKHAGKPRAWVTAVRATSGLSPSAARSAMVFEAVNSATSFSESGAGPSFARGAFPGFTSSSGRTSPRSIFGEPLSLDVQIYLGGSGLSRFNDVELWEYDFQALSAARLR